MIRAYTETMNDEIIQDLKQFISVTVSQQISGLEDRLTNKIDDLSQSVADAMDRTNSVVDDQLKDHDRRITKLESKTV